MRREGRLSERAVGRTARFRGNTTDGPVCFAQEPVVAFADGRHLLTRSAHFGPRVYPIRATGVESSTDIRPRQADAASAFLPGTSRPAPGPSNSAKPLKQTFHVTAETCPGNYFEFCGWWTSRKVSADGSFSPPAVLRFRRTINCGSTPILLRSGTQVPNDQEQAQAHGRQAGDQEAHQRTDRKCSVPPRSNGKHQRK